MKKYWLIFLTSLQNNLAYRFNFLFWHLGQILSFLVSFFVWTAIFQYQTSIYHYSFSYLLTYIFGTMILKSLVFNSRTYELASIINNGNLSLYLLKPLNLFKYYFSRDLSDKVLNFFFLIVELPLLYLLFKPSLFFQTNWVLLLSFALSLLLAFGLYFYLSFIFGLIGFWSRDVWAPRFLLLVILDFATGAIFPLDMLPSQFHYLIQLLPFSYMMFIPLHIYLGKSGYPWQNLGIGFLWLLIFYFLAHFIWQRGLKRYEAEGR